MFIMGLKVKAREKLQKVGKYAGTYRYVMLPDLYTSLSQEKVIREAALRSGVSEGMMHACWDAAGDVIKAWCTEGHSVPLPGLGTMRFSLSAKSVADVNDVKSSLITTRRIVFTPAVELKDELRNTSINITCYDRNGDVVKQVTSTDDGTIEDGTDPTPSGEGNETPGGNTGTIETGDGTNTGGNTGGNSGDNPGGNTGGGTNPDPDDPNPEQDE